MRLHLRPDGNWFQPVDPLPGAAARPTLFLDRDGTVVEQVHFLSNPAEVRLVAGAAEAIVRARAAGWRVVLTPNQSGIGRGIFGWEAFAAAQAERPEEQPSAPQSP